MLDMCKQYPWKFCCQHWATKHTWWHRWVDRMICKVAQFFLLCFFYTQLILDIFLCSIFDANESKSQINFLVHNHFLGIGTSVHDINFCDYTNCPDAFWIEPSCCPDTFRACHIGVCWYYTKNDGSCIWAVPFNHASSNCFNILILTFDWNECDTWQVNQSQIWACVWIDIKHNCLVNNVFSFATHSVSEHLYVFFHLLHVIDFLSWNFFRENSPRFTLVIQVVQAQLEWPPRANTIASRQEIKTHDCFKDRWFSSRLSTNHGNPWQTDSGVLDTDIPQVILHTNYY